MAMTPKYKTDASGNYILDSNNQKILDIRNTQLNEKISEEEYQIVHPETNAYQVITDSNRRFVSDAEKKIWGQAWDLAATALHYKGVYSSSNQYQIFDVVYYETGNYRGFFIYYNPTIAATLVSENSTTEEKKTAYETKTSVGSPDFSSKDSKGWINIDLSAYLARFSDTVKASLVNTDTNYYISFAARSTTTNTQSSEEYRNLSVDSNFLYNPGTNTLTIQNSSGAQTISLNGSTGTITAKKFVGDVEGSADEAEKYVTYVRDTNGNLVLDSNGDRQKESSEYIEDELLDLSGRIDTIVDGGTIVKNKLKIQKNGETLNEPGFNGSVEQTVNITFKPEEITDLLNDSDHKIKDKWLPSTVLGAMIFCGTFDPSTGNILVDLRPHVQTGTDSDGNPIYSTARRDFKIGDYLIAVGEGNIDPSGNARSDSDKWTPDSSDTNYFTTGDWAVYTDTTDDNISDPDYWVKIDNTDAVRTVNGQIGNVKTYKGVWNNTDNYYAGDIVSYGDALYIATADTVGAKEDGSIPDTFLIFGRTYKASDGIELDIDDDYTFKHIFKSATSAEESSSPNPLQTIVASEITLNDTYGHVGSTIKKTITLPDDTWRAVKIYNYTTNSYEEGLKQRSFKDTDPLALQLKGDQVVKVDWNSDHVDFSHVNNGALGSYVPTSDSSITLHPGSSISFRETGWDKYGHTTAVSTHTFKISENLIQHEHFNVIKDANGDNVIRAYEDTLAEFQGLQNKTLKFYRSSAVGGAYSGTAPSDITMSLALNGVFAASKLYQSRTRYDGTTGTWRSVDETVRILSGKSYDDTTDLYGVYNDNTAVIEMADSGVVSGVYSAAKVNSKGIVTSGGQIVEFGSTADADPDSLLVIGGLFFRMHDTADTNGQ